MDNVFGRVFGSCFRGWLQSAPSNANKYVDFAPNRKEYVLCFIYCFIFN